MKKITRRQFMQCAGVVAAVSALSACGKSESSAPVSGSAGTSSSEKVAEKKELILFLNETEGTDAYIFMREVAALEKFKDVNIDIQNYGPQLEEKLPTYVSGGQRVDLVTIENPTMAAQFAAAGMTIPVDDYAAAVGIDYATEFGETYVPYMEYDGKKVMIPSTKQTWVTYYVKDIFDKAGEPYPDPEIPMTWDDYQDVALRLTSGTGNDKVFGAFYIPNWEGYFWCNAISELGGGTHFYKEDGMSNIQDPAYARSLQRIYDMMHVDQSMPTHAELATLQSNATTFMNGRYGMGIGGQWFVEWYRNPTQYPRDWKIGIAPLSVHEGTTCKTWGTLQGLAVSCTTGDAQLAFEFALEYNHYYAEHTTVQPVANMVIESPSLYTGDEILPEGDFTVAEMKYCFANPKAEFLAEKIQGTASAVYQKICQEESERFFVQEITIQEAIDNIESRANEAIAEKLAEG